MNSTNRQNWVIKMKTAKVRFSRGLERIKQWVRRNHDVALRDMIKKLSVKIVGHANNYGVAGNSASVIDFSTSHAKTHNFLNPKIQEFFEEIATDVWQMKSLNYYEISLISRSKIERLLCRTI